MAERKFNFVSPGIFVDEIDNSQLTRTPGEIGPVIIGRTERGPAMRPVKVSSFSEFVEIFGNPIAGGLGSDVYRDGNYQAPTYAAYAAQAWLRNNNAATIVRLLGAEHTNRTGNGVAGWITTRTDPNANLNSCGGAYGLFLANDATTAQVGKNAGVLAAIIYTVSGTAPYLSGTLGDDTAGNKAAGTFIKSESDGTFILAISSSTAPHDDTFKVNFDDASPYFIRKQLNTNPAKTNGDVHAGTNEKYWLGESYEGMVNRNITTSAKFAFVAALASGSVANAVNHNFGLTPARTGFVFSQDLSSDHGVFDAQSMQKLFRFIAINSGEWEQQNLKISIENIKIATSTADPYGTFDVVVRMASDSDNAPRILERYTGCNLNPNSTNYVGLKIGDTYPVWDDVTRSYRFYGSYPNRSRYIRLDINQDVDSGGTDAAYLPFGFYGKPRYKKFFISGSTATTNYSGSIVGSATSDTRDADLTFVTGHGAYPSLQAAANRVSVAADFNLGGIKGAKTDEFVFPAPLLRISGSDGAPSSLKNTYWGVTTRRPGGTAFDPSYKDMVRVLGGITPNADGDQLPSSGVGIEYSHTFTLDDIKVDGTAGSLSSSFFFESGSRKAGTAYRVVANATDAPTGATVGSYDVLLKKGLDRFTLDLHGGFDGVDVQLKDPFSNTAIGVNSSVAPRAENNYAFNTLKRAVDTVADPEVAEFNLMLAPGIKDTGVTGQMLEVCEDRGDALAIIDLEGDYVPAHENTSTAQSRKGVVATVVNNLEARALNTSYGCAYYPWVQIRDPQAGNYVWVPPSIAALGTFSSSERNSELWFAPAGFRRGGLTDGVAGLPVINVADRLTSSDRDTLYAANINPIASFPNEGIVIFGQKTLQVTPSALDRINVRRLMIFVKKQISRMATRVLFDQNVPTTWNRFLSMVEPFLRDVEARFGLDDYKVVLDETTTTPDLIDRNIMYAKIFLKPTRAIEFIALDFTITNSGASFAD